MAPAQAQSQSAAWKPFSPRGAGFSVSMPGVPKGERTVSKEKDGTQTVDQDYELESESLLLKVGYQEHDAGFARLVNVPELLDEVSQAALKDMGGARAGAKPRKIALNGFEGREVSAKAEGGSIRLRVFWAGRRLYLQMAAFAPASKADAERFIASLKLARPQPK